MTDLNRARRILRQSLICLDSAEHEIVGGYVALPRQLVLEIREHLADDVAEQEAEIKAESARERDLELSLDEIRRAFGVTS